MTPSKRQQDILDMWNTEDLIKLWGCFVVIVFIVLFYICTWIFNKIDKWGQKNGN